jgi:hypothetical protein
MNQQGDSVDSWRVYTNVMSSILSFDLGSTLAAPEDPMTVQLTYGQLPPSEMAAIYSELWPPINRRLAAGAPIPLRGAIDVAADWLRTGAGFPGPFGYQPSEEAAAIANGLGHSLLTDLEALVTGHPGLTAYLRQTADRFDHVTQLDVEGANAAFFTEVDIGTNWQGEIATLQDSIREAVSSWALDNPSAVMERLTTVQQELEVAGSRWPDRVQMAIAVVAELVSDVVPWIEAALDAGMFPAANPLLETAVANGAELEMRLWERCLSNAGSRWTAVGAALTGEVSNQILRLVLRELQPSDYRLFEWMFIRGELSDDRARLLLAETSPHTAAAGAAAMFQGGRRDSSWSPGEVEAEWLEALEQLDFQATTGLEDYTAAELVGYLARSYPDCLVRLIQNRLRAAPNGQVYRVLTHSSWDRLHLLPRDAKTFLWQEFSDRPPVRWLLGQHLLGADVEWLDDLLESGVISPDRALDLYSGLGPHPNIEDLARILVPKGVDPRAVASLAQSGTWVGEESARYASLVERFRGYVESTDPSIAAVGQAGVEIFEKAQHAAEEKERIRRVRGEL